MNELSEYEIARRSIELPFANRAEAGRILAGRLLRYRGEDVIVLALPRGGVPVAAEVARALAAPLDALLVRELGLSWYSRAKRDVVTSSRPSTVSTSSCWRSA